MNPVLVCFETLTLVLAVAAMWPLAEVLIAHSCESRALRSVADRDGSVSRLVGVSVGHSGDRCRSGQQGWPDPE